jgi:hypothetical protein
MLLEYTTRVLQSDARGREVPTGCGQVCMAKPIADVMIRDTWRFAEA